MYSGPSNMLLKRPIYLQDPTGDKEKCLTRTFKKSRMKSNPSNMAIIYFSFYFYLSILQYYTVKIAFRIKIRY